jgi:hypothetical protein
MRPRLLTFVALASATSLIGIQLTRASATAQVAAGKDPPSDSTPPMIASPGPTDVVMHNVDFRQAPGIVLGIRAIEGRMHSVKHGVVDFDDKMSYILTVDTGHVVLSADVLTTLMNNYVFAYRGAPLKHLQVMTRGTSLGLRGTLHKGVDIPFDMTSAVSLTPDEKMRLHPTKMKIFGVDGLILMRALGLSLQKMVDLSGAKGVVAQGNDLILSPLVLLPPPVIQGHIVAVRVGPGGLEQDFGKSKYVVRGGPLPDSTARNYMLYRGGTLHFGKLYMTDAELLVVDLDTHDPFDFDNDRYQKQLVAGHSRTLPSLGLEVYMPDADKVGAAGAVASRSSPR